MLSLLQSQEGGPSQSHCFLRAQISTVRAGRVTAQPRPTAPSPPEDPTAAHAAASPFRVTPQKILSHPAFPRAAPAWSPEHTGILITPPFWNSGVVMIEGSPFPVIEKPLHLLKDNLPPEGIQRTPWPFFVLMKGPKTTQVQSLPGSCYTVSLHSSVPKTFPRLSSKIPFVIFSHELHLLKEFCPLHL